MSEGCRGSGKTAGRGCLFRFAWREDEGKVFLMPDYLIDDELAVALRKAIRRMVDEGWQRDEIVDEITGFIDEIMPDEDD